MPVANGSFFDRLDGEHRIIDQDRPLFSNNSSSVRAEGGGQRRRVRSTGVRWVDDCCCFLTSLQGTSGHKPAHSVLIIILARIRWGARATGMPKLRRILTETSQTRYQKSREDIKSYRLNH